MSLLVALVILVGLLVIGVPVPIVFLTTVIYFIFTQGYDPSFLVPYGFSQLNNTVLLAVPLFIIAGSIMSYGGIGKRIVEFAQIFVGRVKGGLGFVTVIACAIFGAISGSAAAALTTVGAIMFPRLREVGYSKGFAASLITSSSILGLLVPPSAIMILYAWVGNQSVLASFLATLGPGIILMLLMSIINYFYMSKEEEKVLSIVRVGSNTPTPPTSKNSRKIIITAIPGLLMPIIILGGIYGGIMTPTEAAAISAVYAIPVGLWVYKELDKKSLYYALIKAGTTTGVLMVMLYSIMILSRIIVMEDVPSKLTQFLLSITDNTVVLLLMINLFLILVGMIMDDVSAVLISTPILLPVVVNLGIDPIHFAGIIGVNIGVGLLTPPTAPLLYLGSRTSDVRVNEMLGPTFLLLLFAWIPTLLLTTYIPEISLFLPRLLLGN
ncbi:TRAP transporter large permease [Salirhabdus salicampi]|uniref:TRAP transporter large permease n=1 Tax=Salirhabdus salicampi TaxID=476102 RepID=UPI0020C55B61|nr:TRAP transporter large permease [Salirhabdus salicampi]MCP8616341.1 TRAP transporter large permease [Salirhabdus salicampi]